MGADFGLRREASSCAISLPTASMSSVVARRARDLRVINRCLGWAGAVRDFLSTIAERGTRKEERPQSGQDLADWIEQSGIVDAAPPVTRQLSSTEKVLRERCTA